MKKEKITVLPDLCITTLSIILLCISWSFILIGTPLHSIFLNSDIGREYKLYDLEDPIERYIEDPIQIAKLKHFYSEIQSLPEYTFFEKIQQPLDIQYFVGAEQFVPEYVNTFQHKQSNYITVNQLIVNVETFKNESISLCNGTGFHEKSCDISQDYHIPVILGNNYLDYFNIGDIIIALNYYEVPTYMVVQGFAEKGSAVTISGETINLDNYIITASPIFDFSPSTIDEMRFQGLLYFQKINSYFKLNSESNIIDVFLSLNSLDHSDKLFPIHIVTYPGYYQNYVCFIGSLPLTITLLCFGLLLLISFCIECYIIKKKNVLLTQKNCIKKFIIHSILVFGIAFFFFVLGKLMYLNQDLLVSTALIFSLITIFLFDLISIMLFKAKEHDTNRVQ